MEKFKSPPFERVTWNNTLSALIWNQDNYTILGKPKPLLNKISIRIMGLFLTLIDKKKYNKNKRAD